jgi:hypothetical protein
VGCLIKVCNECYFRTFVFLLPYKSYGLEIAISVLPAFCKIDRHIRIFLCAESCEMFPRMLCEDYTLLLWVGVLGVGVHRSLCRENLFIFLVLIKS